ncbi:hypothetical protein B0J11DRAFT_505054 [Dendryphion nanum]|uniref:Mid2 domain-containing protein n=1 Tax=Dendryphion nanum TaxID=256645 RepID=A0A9P9E0N1_9PLEO|nr:hypothetical protein B0J11DRAFT_505054 [Dendryphion nanum]
MYLRFYRQHSSCHTSVLYIKFIFHGFGHYLAIQLLLHLQLPFPLLAPPSREENTSGVGILLPLLLLVAKDLLRSMIRGLGRVSLRMPKEELVDELIFVCLFCKLQPNIANTASSFHFQLSNNCSSFLRSTMISFEVIFLLLCSIITVAPLPMTSQETTTAVAGVIQMAHGTVPPSTFPSSTNPSITLPVTSSPSGPSPVLSSSAPEKSQSSSSSLKSSAPPSSIPPVSSSLLMSAPSKTSNAPSASQSLPPPKSTNTESSSSPSSEIQTTKMPAPSFFSIVSSATSYPTTTMKPDAGTRVPLIVGSIIGGMLAIAIVGTFIFLLIRCFHKIRGTVIEPDKELVTNPGVGMAIGRGGRRVGEHGNGEDIPMQVYVPPPVRTGAGRWY